MPARKKSGSATRTLKIRQIHSGICTPKQHKRTLHSLGFRRLNQTVELPDNPAVRGMIQAVCHLVEIV